VTSQVVVHLKLVGMRAEPDRVDLINRLPLDPGVDQVLGENPALEQVVMVSRQRRQHLGERPGNLLDLGMLLRRQLVEVLVDRRWGLTMTTCSRAGFSPRT